MDRPGKAVWLLAISATILAVACLLIWRYRFETYHLATVQDGVLYRDGVRSRREFRTMAERVKPKTIVSLVDDREMTSEPFVSEMAYCQANGITVIRVPITLGGWPDGEQVRQFLDVVNDPKNQPVVVHCAQGVRRTGMMVAAYQESVLGFDKAKAKDAMLTFGHSQRTVGDVQRFIDVYDPKERTMTEKLALSQE
jgi:tyrosine-protein phosphatase SIW14